MAAVCNRQFSKAQKNATPVEITEGMKESNQRYANPPIQEAVCEIFPVFEEPLTADQLNQIKDVWSSTYPKMELVKEIETKFKVGGEGAEWNQQEIGQRLVCRSSDGKLIAQLAGTSIAVNHLADYPGWAGGFKQMILDRFSEVLKLFPADKVQRLALRYIDRIEIPAVPMRWNDWFEVDLNVPPSFQNPGAKLNLTLSNEIADQLTATMVLANVDQTTLGKTSVIFDLNVVSTRGFSVDQLETELDRVHDPHSLAFESVLKDTTRDLFR